MDIYVDAEISTGITNYNAAIGTTIVDTHVDIYGGWAAYGIQITNGSSDIITMTNVEVWAEALDQSYGISIDNADVDMHHVTATVIAVTEPGDGVKNWDGYLNVWDSVFDGRSASGESRALYTRNTYGNLTNVTMRGSGASAYGIKAYAPTSYTYLFLHNVIFESAFYRSLYGYGSTATVTVKAEGCVFNGMVEANDNTSFYIANSQFLNGASFGVIGSPTFYCFGNYDQNLVSFTCP